MKNTGDGRRVARMEKEVQQAVAGFLVAGFSSAYGGMITVTHVRMPADLRTAKVYVSILLPTDADEKKLQPLILKELQEMAPEAQSYLASMLKARYCPKITFYQDESTEHVLKVERLLHEIELEKKNRGEG